MDDLDNTMKGNKDVDNSIVPTVLFIILLALLSNNSIMLSQSPSTKDCSL